MKLVFLGASGFAVPSLKALASSSHELVAVVVPPAAPAGRGRRPRRTPVEDAARAAGLTVLDPTAPNDPAFVAALAELRPDLGVLVAFGCILRPDLLAAPARGFLNLHPSLLPRWRGAAPIPRALMAGDTRTGVTVIRLNERVDAGDILAQEPVPIGPDETAGELSDRLAAAGANLLLTTFDRLARQELPGATQDPALVTPAPKLRPPDRVLDWTRPATELHNRVRALSPEPGAVAGFRDRRLLVLRSHPSPADGSAPPGSILADRPGFVAATGNGTLEILELRPEGGRRQSGRDFRNGARLSPGERLT
ncbi:MAG: methionyl-tRNA formyltransferase [bacterium]